MGAASAELRGKSINFGEDIGVQSLPKLSWAPDDQSESLRKVADYVSGVAERAIAWYLKSKRVKSLWARILRVLAILLTAVAGLIPILAELWTGPQGAMPVIAPGWAAAALLAAATCVGLDQFFGFSSAWMRFITSEIQIKTELQEFQFQLEGKWAALGSSQPTADQCEEILTICRNFLTQVNTIISEETERWVQEFSAVLKDIDKAAKAKAEALRLGGANVTVTNGQESKDGWTLAVDSGPPERHLGKSAALRSLTPGLHAVRAKGDIGGKTMQSAKTFTVAAGVVANVELTLE